MGFTPVSGNFGGTHLLADGATKVTTRRFDSLVTEQDIYFLKLDMEGAEKHSVGPGKPMDKWFRWGCGARQGVGPGWSRVGVGGGLRPS